MLQTLGSQSIVLSESPEGLIEEPARLLPKIQCFWGTNVRHSSSGKISSDAHLLIEKPPCKKSQYNMSY